MRTPVGVSSRKLSGQCAAIKQFFIYTYEDGKKFEVIVASIGRALHGL